MVKDVTRDIHALPAKLKAMAEVLYEKGRVARPSLKELAAYANIHYEALKSSRTKGRLSRTNETKLATALGFDVDNSAWLDTSVAPSRRSRAEGHDYPGRDSSDEFRYMLRSAHDLPAGHFIRVESQRPSLLDSNLAILGLSDSGQQTASYQALQLFFSIILEPGYHESGLSFGFCRVRLRFVFEGGSRVQLISRLGADAEIEIANAKLSVRGGPHLPEWYLAIPDGVLQGEYVNRADALCELAGTKIGESFFAELSVRLMDGMLRAPCGAQLPGDVKKIIIKQLFAQRLEENADSQGWLTLGRQELRIVRADQL